MAAPPPRAGEEEEQLWDGEEEGAGESSFPPCCGDLHELRRRILERLRRTKAVADDDVASSSFQRRLACHLQRMPSRYLTDIDAHDKIEDFLLHWKILDQCADPDKRPVFHARHIKTIVIPAVYNCKDEELEKPCQRLMKGLSLERRAVEYCESKITSPRVVPFHEITFCSVDRPKLLCKISQLFDEVGLHIREGHLYCTIDGFCLGLFLVDGWETEETDTLIAKIKMALAKDIELFLSLVTKSNPTNSSTLKKMLVHQHTC